MVALFVLVIEPRLLRAQVHSTTALPQRRWSSNSVQDQRVSRPTTFSLRNGSRPMSTLGSRPVSGFSNRPVSGRISAQSRPGTALNKSVPPLLLQDSRSDVSVISLIWCHPSFLEYNSNICSLEPASFSSSSTFRENFYAQNTGEGMGSQEPVL